MHARLTETTGTEKGFKKHIVRPDDDCSFCDGMGEALFMIPNNPKNVVRGR